MASVRLSHLGSRYIPLRQFASTPRNQFISNFFGNKDIKQREDIVKKQDDYEVDPNSKIVILNKDNSPNTKPFSVENDMQDFKIHQWKSKVVSDKDLETTYTSENLSSIISEAYKEIKNVEIKAEDFSKADLHDLSFRFQFAKLLQQKLGFNINDYILTKSHTLEQLYIELIAKVSTRWVSERNPNGIVLRPEDFTSPNVYLSDEPSKDEQDIMYNKLVEEAKKAF